MPNVEVGAVMDGEPRMLLKTIVAATSPWVRIHALRFDLGKLVLTRHCARCRGGCLGRVRAGEFRLRETRRLRTPGLAVADPGMAR
jgi:hypothetical protein